MYVTDTMKNYGEGMRPLLRWIDVARPQDEPDASGVLADVVERGGLVLK